MIKDTAAVTNQYKAKEEPKEKTSKPAVNNKQDNPSNPATEKKQEKVSKPAAEKKKTKVVKPETDKKNDTAVNPDAEKVVVPESTKEILNIFQTINRVMADIGVIAKDKISDQHYNYRGVDQVMNALQPAMIKHGLFIVPEVLENFREVKTTSKGNIVQSVVMKLKYRFYAVDGSYVDAFVIGEAMDSGDKASNKALSIAYKYACFQVFSIPTEEIKDPDDENHQLGKSPEQAADEERKAEDERQKIASQKIGKAKIAVIQGEMNRTGINLASMRMYYPQLNFIEDITEGLFPEIMEAFKKTPTKKG
jgi:hypothetical protein